MATKPQLAMIHIGKASLRLDDGDYRDIMQQMFGVRSAKDLNGKQAGEFIEWFEKQGFESKKPSAPLAPLVRGEQKSPSDGKETINEKQQECIEAFRLYLGWDEKRMMKHCKKIVKEWWPQNRAQGVKLTINLIVINAERILRNIRFLDESKLTTWERGFLYFNQPNALEEFGFYVSNKNKRGKRTMPKCSLLKLFEILRNRPMKPLGVGPVETSVIPHSGHEGNE